MMRGRRLKTENLSSYAVVPERAVSADGSPAGHGDGTLALGADMERSGVECSS